jgi:isopenicillin-N epimerase
VWWFETGHNNAIAAPPYNLSTAAAGLTDSGSAALFWYRIFTTRRGRAMERRNFVKGLAAGLVAMPMLPEAVAALASRLDSLQTDLSSGKQDGPYWQRVRKEFMLNPDLVHLNTGSVGACPQMVVDALANYARQLEGDPLNNVWGGIGAGVEEVRAKAAASIGASVDEVTITRNTTEGMNETAVGLHLAPKDEVLTTNHEHGGGMACWQYLAKHYGVIVRYLELPDAVHSKAQLVDLVASQLTKRTRVCSFSHIDTITGMVFPMAEVAALTRPRGIVLVCDGAQVPGMLQVDVKALGVDVYCSSSHKWMLAPKGSGLYYVRKEMQERITPPLLYNGMNVYTGATGTRNVPTILAHGVAMDFHNAIGRDKVEARCRQLSALVRDQLQAIPGLTCLTPAEPELSSGLCTFALDPAKGTSGQLAGRLAAEHNILVKTAQGTYAYVPAEQAKPQNYNALRIATHVYNTEEQVMRLAGALRGMLG